MAVASEFQDLRSELTVKHFDFDPDATTLTDIGWQSIEGLESIMCSFFRTIGTSALVFKILGNTKADGSGTDIEIKTRSGTPEPDAVGDQIFLEATADEIRGAASGDILGVSAQASFATGTDEGVVTYIRRNKHRKLNNTPNIIA